MECQEDAVVVFLACFVLLLACMMCTFCLLAWFLFVLHCACYMSTSLSTSLSVINSCHICCP